MTELKLLLPKAKDGSISSVELEHVKSILRRQDAGAGDLYTALHIVGLAAGPDCETLVRPYVDFSSDPMVARIALQVLYGYWGLSEGLAGDIGRFLAGVEWDVEGDVRQMAISLSGKYLHHGLLGKAVGTRLLQIAEDDFEGPILRQDAVHALALGMGYSPHSIPGTGSQARVDSDWSRKILEQARHAFSAGQIGDGAHG